MQRDRDLIRKILLDFETSYSAKSYEDRLQKEGYTENQIDYHAYLIIQGGLAEGERFYTHDGCRYPRATIANLTWQGHEFTDAVKNESVWNKTREYIMEKGGSVPFTFLSQLVLLFLNKHYS